MPVTQDQLQEAVVGFYDRGLHLPHGKRIIDLGVSKILKSEIWSPYLINTRHLQSFDQRSQVPVADQARHTKAFLDGYVDILNDLNAKKRFDHIIGPAQAGTPLMAGAAALGGFSLLWERVPEEGKTHGAHSAIEGNFYEGEEIVIGDDVLTEAKAKLQTVAKIKEAGMNTTRVVSGVDREQGGRALLDAAGIEFSAVLGITTVADMLHEAGRIDVGERNYLHEYTASQPVYQEPAQWYWQNNQ